MYFRCTFSIQLLPWLQRKYSVQFLTVMHLLLKKHSFSLCCNSNCIYLKCRTYCFSLTPRWMMLFTLYKKTLHSCQFFWNCLPIYLCCEMQCIVYCKALRSTFYGSKKGVLPMILYLLKYHLKAIHFVKSVCTIFSLWKQDPSHQTFQS